MSKLKQTETGEIPKKWHKVPFENIADIVKDGYKLNHGGEFPYIGLEHINQQTLSLNSVGHSYEVESNKFHFRAGDILFGKLRPYFRKVYRPRFEGVCSTDIWVVRAKEGIDQGYLFYLMANQEFIDLATSGSCGTRMPRADWDHLKNTEWFVPSLESQRAIAKILSDLDEKIELNHQMNKTLESIAQAIFKRWFVEFEFPDEKGRPYKSSSGKMIGSELGEIPQGWAIGKLGDIGTFKNGINYLRDEVGDTSFFIANVRDIANNKLLLKESLDKINIDSSKAKDYLLQEKDILIARSASPGEISLVLGDLGNVIYSGFSIRYRLNNSNNYLYMFHIMQGLKRNLQNYSIGTTLQSVNQETLKNMKLILPSDEILKEFNKISKQILDKTLNNLLQNRELSQIRDSLLPRLMSGKIRVR